MDGADAFAPTSLLALVPLVQVAWADGRVSARERTSVLAAAAARGIEADSRAHRELVAWLAVRPPDDFFARALGALRRALHALPPDKRAASARGLVAGCAQVAAVSGGWLGFGRTVSAAERALVERIAWEITR